jgi:hypothetical protein
MVSDLQSAYAISVYHIHNDFVTCDDVFDTALHDQVWQWLTQQRLGGFVCKFLNFWFF